MSITNCKREQEATESLASFAFGRMSDRAFYDSESKFYDSNSQIPHSNEFTIKHPPHPHSLMDEPLKKEVL